MKSESQVREIHRSIPHVPGVYMLINPTNNKKYIGSSIDLYNRYYTFLSSARSGYYSGTDGKDSLREDILKTPPYLWCYSILEFCEINELEERENYYIDLFNSIEEGYNKVYSHRNPISNDSLSLRIDGATLTKMRNCYSNFKSNIRDYYNLNKYYQGPRLSEKDMYSEFKMEEVYNKKQYYIEKNHGNPVRCNYDILTLRKKPNEKLILNDIIWIPKELGILLLKRNKPNRSIIEESSFLCDRMKAIMEMTENLKGRIDKEVYDILMNLSINDVSRLIYR